MSKELQELQYPPIKPFSYTIVMGTIRFLIRLMTRYHVTGSENVPKKGAVIITPNHLHYLDVPAGAPALTRYSWGFAAAKYQNHWLFGPVLKYGTGAIWVKRGKGDKEALQTALNVLLDGQVLVISPEGTRSRTGALRQGKSGAAYLASQSGATFVPMAIWGASTMFPSWKKFRRPDIYVVYGEPFSFPQGDVSRDVLKERTVEIMTSIAAVLPEELRGIYTDHPQTLEKLAALEESRDG